VVVERVSGWSADGGGGGGIGGRGKDGGKKGGVGRNKLIREVKKKLYP
jgi:hypothetical protein